MHRHSLETTAWAVALTVMSAVTLPDPPLGGARALLGWTPPRAVGTSELGLAHTHGRVSAERALLGKLTASDEHGSADAAVRIRPHPINGSTALLGR